MTYAAKYNPEVDAPTNTLKNVKVQYSGEKAIPIPVNP